MASFGMMNPAYFVSKNVLLEWVNNFLEIQIDKIEQCANGAIYCNMFDALHPGLVPMKRVDFTVKHEFEFVKNWKLLQNAFQKAQIQKMIPVQRLVKARYQDNLEFLQWFYKYARDTYNGDPDEPTYDATGRRSKSKGGRDYTGSSTQKNNHRNNRKSNNNRRSGKENKSSRDNHSYHRPISASNNNNTRSNNYRSGTQSQRSSVINNQNQQNQHNNQNNNKHQNNNNNNNNYELEELRNENKRLIENRDSLQLKLEQLTRDHDELSTVAKDIEKERDFYFNKVLSVESLCKQNSDQTLPVLEAIYNLLYQTEEEATDGPQQNDDNSNGEHMMNEASNDNIIQ